MENNGFIKIPNGKQVRFKQGGELLEGTENAKLLLEEDINLMVSSSFSSVIDSSASSLLSIVSREASEIFGENVGGYLTGQWKQFGFQTWNSTQPLSTSITIVVSMDKNAYEDVVIPLWTLAKLALPYENSKGGLLGPGPSLSNSLTESNTDEKVTDDNDRKVIAGRQLHCYIGNYLLKNVIVKAAQPTFSRHVDQFGWPISGRIQLDISTIFSATTNMIDDMIGIN